MTKLPWTVPLALIVVLVVAVFLWPVRYPSGGVADTDSGGTIYKIKPGQPLEQTVSTGGHKISGLVFWSNESPNLGPETTLQLTIRSSTGIELLSRTKTFGQAFEPTSRTITFIFPGITSPQHDSLTIQLAISRINGADYLPLRQPDTNSPVAYSLLSKQSVISILWHKIFTANTDGEDISYYWRRGAEILHGDNPYICAADNTCLNHKVPIHFPLFYWLSAFSEKLGLADFDNWIAFWRPVFWLFYWGIGAIILVHLTRRKQWPLALFGAMFWFLNRWSLYVIRVGHLDFAALFFLILSVVTLKKHWWWSLMLLGLSLATKQVAIFLVPVYLILAWQKFGWRWSKLAWSFVAIIAAPLIVSLPFLLNHPCAMIKAVLFSATRGSEADFGAPAISAILQTTGIWGVFIMLLVMASVYIVVWRQKLPLSLAALMVFISFIAFNKIIFNQYFVWCLPFVPLALGDMAAALESHRSNVKHRANTPHAHIAD